MGFEPAHEHPYSPHMDQGFEFHRPLIEEDGQAHVKVKHINYDFTKLSRFQVCVKRIANPYLFGLKKFLGAQKLL